MPGVGGERGERGEDDSGSYHGPPRMELTVRVPLRYFHEERKSTAFSRASSRGETAQRCELRPRPPPRAHPCTGQYAAGSPARCRTRSEGAAGQAPPSPVSDPRRRRRRPLPRTTSHRRLRPRPTRGSTPQALLPPAPIRYAPPVKRASRTPRREDQGGGGRSSPPALCTACSSPSGRAAS